MCVDPNQMLEVCWKGHQRVTNEWPMREGVCGDVIGLYCLNLNSVGILEVGRVGM